MPPSWKNSHGTIVLVVDFGHVCVRVLRPADVQGAIRRQAPGEILRHQPAHLAPHVTRLYVRGGVERLDRLGPHGVILLRLAGNLLPRGALADDGGVLEYVRRQGRRERQDGVGLGMPALVVDALREAERLGRVEGELLLDGLLIEVDRGVVRHLPRS